MSNGARKRLKDGFEKFNTANEELESLIRAMQAAQRSLQEAEDDLASFDDLDAQITKFRVEASKKGARPRSLPDDLKARDSGRRDAAAEVAQAKMTLEAIEDENATAERKLKALQDDRIKLVLEVFQELAEGLYAELASVNAKRQELLDQLSGLAETSVHIDGRIQFVGHTPYGVRLTSLENDSPISPWPGGITAAQANSKRWDVLISKLMKDPDADIAVPKPVRPSDVIMGSVPPGGLVFMRQFTLRPEE
jgi:hypothetical protein